MKQVLSLGAVIKGPFGGKPPWPREPRGLDLIEEILILIDPQPPPPSAKWDGNYGRASGGGGGGSSEKKGLENLTALV